uniref:Uncharacterized protein n=1 Tax=Setaria italica TaxID=4555 RepID=K3ZE66_SETIT
MKVQEKEKKIAIVGEYLYAGLLRRKTHLKSKETHSQPIRSKHTDPWTHNQKETNYIHRVHPRTHMRTHKVVT